jgi:rod shape-determining protein MreC
MMMLRRDNRGRRSKLVVFGVLAVVCLYALTRPASVDFFANTLGTVVTPVAERGGNSIEASVRSAGFFSDKDELLKENAQLKNDILSLSLKIMDRNLLAEENQELKQSLGRDEETQRVLATVLTRPASSPYGTVLLDVGTFDGVGVGDRVVREQVVLGEVVRVHEMTALVQPYASAGVRFTALLGTDTVVPIVVVGRGGGNYLIEIPRDTRVAVGDEVTLPALAPYLLGTVEFIDIQSNDPFKQILFKTPVSLDTIRSVEVVLDSAIDEEAVAALEASLAEDLLSEDDDNDDEESTI